MKAQQLRDYLSNALETFDSVSILHHLLDVCDKDEKEDLKEKIKSIHESEMTGIYIPVKTLEQEMKIESFIKTEIFPYYSDQQTYLPFHCH